MTQTQPEIRTMSDYSAQVAQRITDAASRDDFLTSTEFDELTTLFAALEDITVNDIDVVLGTAQGCLRASKILDAKGIDGGGLFAVGLDLLSIATNAYGHVLAMAYAASLQRKH